MLGQFDDSRLATLPKGSRCPLEARTLSLVLMDGTRTQFKSFRTMGMPSGPCESTDLLTFSIWRMHEGENGRDAALQPVMASFRVSTFLTGVLRLFKADSVV